MIFEVVVTVNPTHLQHFWVCFDSRQLDENYLNQDIVRSSKSSATQQPCRAHLRDLMYQSALPVAFLKIF